MFSIILDPMYFLNQNNGSSAHCRRHYLAQHAGLIQDSPFPELSIPPETGAEMDGMALCTLHHTAHCTTVHIVTLQCTQPHCVVQWNSGRAAQARMDRLSAGPHCHIALQTASLFRASEHWERAQARMDRLSAAALLISPQHDCTA